MQEDLRERAERSIKSAMVVAREEVKKPLVSSGSFAHFSSCWEKWAVGDRSLIAAMGKSRSPAGETLLPAVEP